MYNTITVNMLKVKESTKISIKSPEDLLEVCKDIADLAQEAFQIVTLNSKNRMIDRHLISLGLLNASLVHPREIFRACILDSAASFLMVHNHPSGDITPSAEDIRMTRQIVEAGKIIDIQPMDHLIIGKRDGQIERYSFREEGIVQF